MIPEIYTLGESYIGKTIDRQKIVFEDSNGNWLVDLNGKKYLDFFTGHGVMCLGYKNPEIIKAMTNQINQLPHLGNHYYLKSQVNLAKKLVDISFGDKVLFANSGGEIVDLSIKLARKRGIQKKDNEAFEIITMENSFHGRSYGALSSTNQKKFSSGMGPMLPGIKSTKFNSIKAIADVINDKTCAILIEPVLGEGGVIPADKEYILNLRKLCDEKDILLIFEEIQCGLGRLGTPFAYNYYNVTPDILLLGKSLGGGLPLSALITTSKIAESLKIYDHGSTFGGNPVACAAASILIDKLNNSNFILNISETGNYLITKLFNLKKKFNNLILDIRGIGLLIGLEFNSEENLSKAHSISLNHGLITSKVANNVLRLLPPFTITKDEIDYAISILDKTFSEI